MSFVNSGLKLHSGETTCQFSNFCSLNLILFECEIFLQTLNTIDSLYYLILSKYFPFLILPYIIVKE